MSLLLTTLPFTMMAQGSRTVHGNVTDEQGEPLIGVTVMAVGSQQGAVTDFDGNYTITVGDGVRQLQFSYVGYEKQTVDIASSTQEDRPDRCHLKRWREGLQSRRHNIA